MIEKPLRFCMVSTFYPPYNFGGDGMHIYRLTNELAKRGHSIDVFYCEDSFLLLNKKHPTGDFPNHPNVKVHRLKSRAGLLSPLITQQTGVPVLKNKLKKALEENVYDVIHYNNMSLIGITALSYGSSDAIKLYTTHEHWLICPMHVLWKYNREVCKKKECLRCQLHGKRPPQLWRYSGLMEKMLKHIDCFLSPSRFTLHKHLDAGLDIPIIQMPYFLPTPPEEVEDTEAEVKPERPYFLFVGRLEEIKGVQNIIPIFKEKPEYDLLIAGGGDYTEMLKEQAKGIENIKFLGRLDHKTLLDYYRKAIAVVVPSICYETFGIIIIEAFSCKTPVIVNNLGALPEVVEDSEGGFIYETDAELIEAMDKIAGNSKLRNELGEKGLRAYQAYWNEDAHLERYINLIDTLQMKRDGKIKEKIVDESFSAVSA
jgi:glycosyltransferase involved in cell wall biosynthesis